MRHAVGHLPWMRGPYLGESNWPGGLVLLLFEAKIFGAFLANDPDFYTGMSQHVCVFFCNCWNVAARSCHVS